MVSIFVAVLTAANITTSPLQRLSIPLQQSPSASISAFAFTRVLPENNFVAHIIEEGETLQVIADHHYNDQEYWKNIWNDNPDIANPDTILVGQIIKIRVPKPEKPAELRDDLQKRLVKLHPQPVYTYIAPTTAVGRSYPRSNYEEVYKAAGEKYGVPWQILYGIHYTETGLRNGEIYNYEGSGAQGPMQFMPATFRAYGVSPKGGEPNINDAEDAIYSAANFIAKHGSLEAGLRYYSGNIPGTLAAARAMGYPN